MFYYNDICARKFTNDDALAVLTNVKSNQEYLREWLGFVDEYKIIQDAENFIMKCISGYGDNSSFTLGIFDGNNHIGTFGLNSIRNNEAEIGYWIIKEYGGRGIMANFLQQIITYARHEFGVISFFASIAVGNTKSINLVKKLQFITDGTILPNHENLYGKLLNHLIYSCDY